MTNRYISVQRQIRLDRARARRRDDYILAGAIFLVSIITLVGMFMLV